MIMWIVAGYIMAAAAFYTYIVATAQEEVQEHSATVVDLADYKRSADRITRKAA